MKVEAMKIVHVVDSISRNAGGLYFSVRSLTGRLNEIPFIRIEVMSRCDEFSMQDSPNWAPVSTELFRHAGPAFLGYCPGLSRSLRASGADVAHTQHIWNWTSSAVHQWHRHTRKPYVVSPRGMLDPWALANSRWKKRIASALYEAAHLRDAACIHALCQSEADSIRAYGLKNPIAIIPNGVDLPVETEERFASRQKTEDQRKILLFLGRLHPKKGLVNALRAWAEIRGQGTGGRSQEEWQFVVAGWDQGGHEAELKRLCDELGLAWADASNIEHRTSNVEHRSEEIGDSLAQQGHLAPLATSGRAAAGTPYRSSVLLSSVSMSSVLFLGPAFGEAKDQLLRRASAFILPSFSEGLPMSVLEAWSYRLPVLMTDHCNLPEGFAADAALRIGTDVESIAEGMRHFLRSPTSDLRSLGLNGRALVERQFTWPQVAAQMKEVYEWVLGGGGVPDCVRQC
jgi:poly(glycerol-phosphate) alpha-glucosyltransferase